MKKFSSVYKSFSNIKRLVFFELKRLLGNPLKLMFYFLVFIVLSFGAKEILSAEEAKLNIAVVDEDGSEDVAMLLSNFEKSKVAGSANLFYMSLGDAKKKLALDELVAVFHISSDTTQNLYEGDDARIEVFISKKDVKTMYLLEYMEKMIELFNLSQSKAMAYLDIMIADESLTKDEIYDEFNDISNAIFFAFLTRGAVINEQNGVDIDYFAEMINVFIGVLLLLTVLFAYFNYYDDYFHGKRTRLISFGYSSFQYSFSRLITSVIISFISLSFILALIKIFFGDNTAIIGFSKLGILLCMAVFLSLLYEGFARIKFLGGYLPVLVIILFTGFSSLFKVNNYLPSFLGKIISYNFVSIFINQIKGYKLGLANLGILLLWLVLLIGLLFSKREARA